MKKKIAECTLDKPTQSLVKLIFDNDMFKEAMTSFNIGMFLKVCIVNGAFVIISTPFKVNPGRHGVGNILKSKYVHFSDVVELDLSRPLAVVIQNGVTGAGN